MLLPAVWIVALALSAFGWGLGIVSLLKLRCQDRLEQVCVSTTLGVSLLAYSVFALSMAGFLRAPLLFGVVGCGAFIVVLCLRQIIPRGPAFAKSLPSKLLMGALLVCMIANFIGALAPISFIDALAYHVYESREFVRAGRLIELRHTWQSYQPISVEMLYTLGIGLLDDRLPPLIDWALGVLTLASTLLLARRVAGRVAGLIAAAAFYCTAMVAWESTSCFVELGIAAGATLSMHALLRWDETEQLPWLVVAGLAAGFAATCKLTAAQLPVYMGIVLLYLSFARRRSLRRSLGAVGLFGALSLALVVPWYLRSFALTGNPVYPFLPSIFGANGTNHEVQQILAFYGKGKSALDILLAPWYLVSEGGVAENGQFLNPLPFLFAPIVLWRAWKGREQRGLLLLCVLWFLLWLKTAQIARYLVPIQPIACALVADSAVFMLSDNLVRKRLAAAACAVFIGFSGLTAVLYDLQFFKVVFGAESRDEYLTRTSWFFPLYQELGRELPPDANVLTDESPTYYLRVRHERMRNAEFLSGKAHLLSLLRTHHYTHILIHNNADIDEALLTVAPFIKRLWRRHYELPSSRTFGGTIPTSATLYHISVDPEINP
jgi:Dolichyl-phosphate-mannose-protein mannosyltransferase